jgi:hypothetical protein
MRLRLRLVFGTALYLFHIVHAVFVLRTFSRCKRTYNVRITKIRLVFASTGYTKQQFNLLIEINS